MTLSDILDRPWKKYVAATVGTVLASVAAKKAVNSVDDYLQLHPPESQVMQLSADQLHELRGDLEGLAYAGGTPEPVMTKVPGLDYEFDGGVYVWKTPEFPKERYKFRRSYKKDDLHTLFDNNDLYQLIGKQLEGKYKSKELVSLTFDDDNNNEIAISFRIDGNYFVGFKKINEDFLSTLQKYDLF